MTLEEKRLELFDYKLSILVNEKKCFLDTASVIARREIDKMTDGEVEDVYSEVMYGNDDKDEDEDYKFSDEDMKDAFR